METNQTTEQSSKPKRVLWYGLGTLALGTLAFFGIKFFKKPKKQNNDNDEENNELDTKKSVPADATNKSTPHLPAAANNDAFPLHMGSKGTKVRILQDALIRTFGVGILARFGPDGYFGNELASALKSKGYALPLQEADFKKITDPPKQEALKPFDPAAIAKGIYNAILAKDYNSAIILLKSIGNTTNYSLVSEEFKRYFIGGVRQTLVNGMLNSFDEKSQKDTTKRVFVSMGLKYDGQKWSV